MEHSFNHKLYLIGSLRNKRIPELANTLRKEMPDVEIFDDWYSAGPEADDFWKEYEQAKGLDYQSALKGHAARHVFGFDKSHLDSSTHVLLVLPAGKSGHMEVMYAEYGTWANTAILLDPDDVRWDVMYQFIPTILNNDKEVSKWVKATPMASQPGHPEASSMRANPKSSKESSIISQGPFKPWQKSQSSGLGSIYGMVGNQFLTEYRDTQRPEPDM